MTSVSKHQPRNQHPITHGPAHPAAQHHHDAKKPALTHQQRVEKSFVSGFDPAKGNPDTAAQAQYNLRGKTDDALNDIEKFLEARIKDASHGADANPTAVKRAQERLALVKAEQATRKKLGHSPAAKVHQLDNADLQKRLDKLTDPATGEIPKLEEQLAKYGAPPYPNTEISKGVAELKKKLSGLKENAQAMMKEQKTRANEGTKGDKLTHVEHAKPVTAEKLAALKDELRTAGTSDLDAYVKKLEAKKKDATSGAFQDTALIKNLEQKLNAAKAEQRLRDGWKDDGEIGKFSASIHGKTEDQLQTVRSNIEAQLARDGGGEVRNPARAAQERAKIAAIDAELKRRGLSPAVTPPPETTPPETEPATDPTTPTTETDPTDPTPPTTGPSGNFSELSDAELKRKYDSAWQIVHGESFAAWPPEVMAQANADLSGAWAEMKGRNLAPDHVA